LLLCFALFCRLFFRFPVGLLFAGQVVFLFVAGALALFVLFGRL
jgi:hypothetical protein